MRSSPGALSGMRAQPFEPSAARPKNKTAVAEVQRISRRRPEFAEVADFPRRARSTVHPSSRCAPMKMIPVTIRVVANSRSQERAAESIAKGNQAGRMANSRKPANATAKNKRPEDIEADGRKTQYIGASKTLRPKSRCGQ